MADQWSYFVLSAKNPQVAKLQQTLNLLGEDGWDLVCSLTTVKTWVNMSGNDLVFVFKKPGVGHQAPAGAATFGEDYSDKGY